MKALYSHRNAVALLFPMILMVAVLTGCDVAPVMPDSGGRDNGGTGTGNGEPANDATLCDGKPASPVPGVYPTTPGSSAKVDSVFTEYERDALARLHDAGWTGKGVHVVIRDQFHADGRQSHGTGVTDIARYYAPAAQFHQLESPGRQGVTTVFDLFAKPDEMKSEQDVPYVRNNSFDAGDVWKGVDELTRVQSGTLRASRWSLQGLDVWAASNAYTDDSIGDNIAAAQPTIATNEFVHLYANDKAPDETGLLHAKSGVIVVGSVDHDREADEWVLSHSTNRSNCCNPTTGEKRYSHSPRAGNAQHAYLVVPDDVDSDTFTGTSFAAPRVSGAFALLKQKCPAATSAQLGFVLLHSARDLGEPGVDEIYGYGLLDIENAMAKAETLLDDFDGFDSTVQPTTGSADEQ